MPSQCICISTVPLHLYCTHLYCTTPSLLHRPISTVPISTVPISTAPPHLYWTAVHTWTSRNLLPRLAQTPRPLPGFRLSSWMKSVLSYVPGPTLVFCRVNKGPVAGVVGASGRGLTVNLSAEQREKDLEGVNELLLTHQELLV